MAMLYAEDIVFEISIRIFKGDESDAKIALLKRRIKSNFKKAKIFSEGSSEAKITSVKRKYHKKIKKK